MSTLQRQRVFRINNAARAKYRSLRGLRFSPLEARLMVIGACVTTHCKFYDDPEALQAGEWNIGPARTEQ